MEKLNYENLKNNHKKPKNIKATSHNQATEMAKEIPREMKIGICFHKTSGNLNLPKVDMHIPKTRTRKLIIGSLIMKYGLSTIQKVVIWKKQVNTRRHNPNTNNMVEKDKEMFF